MSRQGPLRSPGASSEELIPIFETSMRHNRSPKKNEKNTKKSKKEGIASSKRGQGSIDVKPEKIDMSKPKKDKSSKSKKDKSSKSKKDKSSKSKKPKLSPIDSVLPEEPTYRGEHDVFELFNTGSVLSHVYAPWDVNSNISILLHPFNHRVNDYANFPEEMRTFHKALTKAKSKSGCDSSKFKKLNARVPQFLDSWDYLTQMVFRARLDSDLTTVDLLRCNREFDYDSPKSGDIMTDYHADFAPGMKQRVDAIVKQEAAKFEDSYDGYDSIMEDSFTRQHRHELALLQKSYKDFIQSIPYTIIDSKGRTKPQLVHEVFELYFPHIKAKLENVALKFKSGTVYGRSCEFDEEKQQYELYTYEGLTSLQEQEFILNEFYIDKGLVWTLAFKKQRNKVLRSLYKIFDADEDLCEVIRRKFDGPLLFHQIKNNMPEHLAKLTPQKLHFPLSGHQDFELLRSYSLEGYTNPLDPIQRHAAQFRVPAPSQDLINQAREMMAEYVDDSEEDSYEASQPSIDFFQSSEETDLCDDEMFETDGAFQRKNQPSSRRPLRVKSKVGLACWAKGNNFALNYATEAARKQGADVFFEGDSMDESSVNQASLDRVF